MKNKSIVLSVLLVGLAVFAAAVWFNVLDLVTLVGASGETAELAASYLRIINQACQFWLPVLLPARFYDLMAQRPRPCMSRYWGAL